jgi:hypothetical protein
MHERLQDVFDGYEILIALTRLAQSVVKYPLPAFAKFIFVRSQIDHCLLPCWPSPNRGALFHDSSASVFLCSLGKNLPNCEGWMS